MIDKYTFYDLETTGLNVRFDVPIQFAAVCTDSDLNITHEVEFRGRPPIHILPSPGALVTTGLTISDVQAANLSFYEFMSRIRSEISGGTPSCYCAFNGIRYDEEMLRHSFYQALHRPYVTQWNGNSRADAMRLLQAVHMLLPGRIVVPKNEDGTPHFKQAALAAANGISGHRVHDAMGDVRTMLDLVRLVRRDAIEVWRMLSTWTNKSAVQEILCTNSVVLSAVWLGRWGKQVLKSLHPICPNPTYATEWALVEPFGLIRR